MSKNTKILYVGQVAYGSTALHRMDALRSLGCEVFAIDTTVPFSFSGRPNLFTRIARGILIRLQYLMDWQRIAAKLRSAARQQEWDVLWVDKGESIRPSVFKVFKALQPHAKLVSYSPDDMFNPANQTKRYLDAMPIFDLYVTTKSYCVEEYLSVGARDVYFVGNAYDPEVHRPMELSDLEVKEFGCDVCFVGAPEPARNSSLEFLAQAGIKLSLYGGDWNFLSQKYEHVRSVSGFVAGDRYAKVLSGSKIALGFLRKQNRDLQTQRSIEIPACGVFMLAERSVEHEGLFEEGVEAEFFATNEELLEKVEYYLSHPAEREEVAARGLKRCEESGYSNGERMRSVLNYLTSN